MLKSLARKNNNTRQRKSKEKQDSVYRRYTHHRRRAFLLDFIGLFGFCVVRIPSRALFFARIRRFFLRFPGFGFKETLRTVEDNARSQRVYKIQNKAFCIYNTKSLYKIVIAKSSEISYNILNKTVGKEGQVFPLRRLIDSVEPLIFPVTERLYLFSMFRIATIRRPMVRITMNSSYVLISISPFRKTRNGKAAALPAAWVNILYS